MYVLVTLAMMLAAGVTTHAETKLGFEPVVLFASLIFFKLPQIFMKTQQGDLKPLASFDGIGQGGSANDQAVAFHAVQVLEHLQFPNKGIFVLLGDLRAKFEHHCSLISRLYPD